MYLVLNANNQTLLLDFESNAGFGFGAYLLYRYTDSITNEAPTVNCTDT